MEEIKYSLRDLQGLHKEYRREGFAKYSSYKGLHESGHFTTENFLIWLKKKEEG